MKILSALFGHKDNAQLSAAIKEGALLVDVRTPEEFSAGSVTDAINVPLDAVANQLAKFQGSKNIVVFCRSGNRSSRAKSILEQNGFRNVINGGTWQNVQSTLGK
jgi:rhodanese-related sulfurtransferase